MFCLHFSCCPTNCDSIKSFQNLYEWQNEGKRPSVRSFAETAVYVQYGREHALHSIVPALIESLFDDHMDHTVLNSKLLEWDRLFFANEVWSFALENLPCFRMMRKEEGKWKSLVARIGAARFCYFPFLLESFPTFDGQSAEGERVTIATRKPANSQTEGVNSIHTLRSDNLKLRLTVPQESQITPMVDMPKLVKYGLRALAWYYLVVLRRNFEFGLSQV